MDPRILDDLTQLTRDLDPRSILLISGRDNPLRARLREARPHTPLTCLEPLTAQEALKDLARQELVLMVDTLDQLAVSDATHLIAALRDLHSECLYILLSEPGNWAEQDLVSLGLERVRRYASPRENCKLFRFNLRDYKKTPDWLNPRYWANPEMWDKARW